MVPIKKIAVKNTAEFLEKAIQTANSFGFADFDALLSKFPATRLKAANKVTHIHPRERATLPLVRTLAAKNMHKYNQHLLGYSLGKSKESKDSFSLHITGSSNAIAEATLIAAAFTLFESVGISDATVHINSLGTTDSFTRYMRDLQKYLKKITNNIPKQVRTDMAVSPLRAYARLCAVDPELSKSCPNAVDYLNDDGRSHLWELLEYLESIEVPYVIDNTVVGSGDFFEHTLFEIKGIPSSQDTTSQTTHTLAYGGRYTTLGRKAFGKHIPITGLTIDIQGSGARIPKKTTTPNIAFYFAQLGVSAKKMGLKVLSLLHKAGIPVGHMVTEHELTTQMHDPRAKAVPYVIIIGHKEALENTVIVRNTDTYKQKVVPVQKLVSYLKRIQK